MLRASVAQNPTIAVSQGRKSAPNVAPGAGGPVRGPEGKRIVPTPPARSAAHPSSASPIAIRNGAESVSSHLIDSVPFQTNQRFTSQNAANPRYAGSPKP